MTDLFSNPEQEKIKIWSTAIENEKKILKTKLSKYDCYYKGLSNIQSYIKNGKNNIFELFFIIKEIINNKDIINSEIFSIIEEMKRKVDDNILQFQQEFTDNFINAVKQKLDVNIKLKKFPSYIISNRYNVDFKFSESVTLLNDTYIVQSIDVKVVANQISENYKEIWKNNPDLKDIKKTINRIFESYKKLLLLSNQKIGDYVSVFDLHKFIAFETQSDSFWKDCRKELFKPYPLEYFKATLSNMIGNSLTTDNGYKIRFAPVRNNDKNSIFLYSPIEDTQIFIGMIKFAKE